MPNLKTCIVVPCYNEAKRLAPETFLDFLNSTDSSVELILVDDGSTDETATVIEEIVANSDGRYQSLFLERNVGKAEAVRFGTLQALQKPLDIVGYWDADLSTPLEQILSFRELLSEKSDVQIVMGSRAKLLGRDIQRSTVRHILGRVLATFISMALGIPCYDTQCGAKAIRVGSRTREMFTTPFKTHWLFDVELIGRYLATREAVEGIGIYEYPLPRWRDVAGSKVRVGAAAYSILELAKLYGRELRHLPRFED